MSRKPGEIYFVRESIIGTDDLSPFVKIGLVAEARSSEKRLLEHQTGNPRRLLNQVVIETIAVHRVEAQMHRLFAPYRIGGEWFKFDDEKIVLEAIAKAKSLAADMERSGPIFDQAEILEKKPSTGEPKPANPEIEALTSQIASAMGKIRACQGLEKIISAKFLEAIERGEDLQGAVEVREVQKEPKFSVMEFRKAHRDLASSYDESSPEWNQKFQSLIEVADFESLDEDFKAELAQIAAFVQQVMDSKSAHLLNEPKLELIRLRTSAEWDLDLATAQLKIQVGTAPGIEGICTWARGYKPKKTFNKGKFAAEHPDLYMEFTLTPAVYKAVIESKKKN